MQADRAEVTKGTVRFKGESITGTAPNRLAGRGIVHVLEGRHVFAHLTVEENLLAGGFLRRPSRREQKDGLEQVYTWFPRPKTKRAVPAGLTSGGEQNAALSLRHAHRAYVIDSGRVALSGPAGELLAHGNLHHIYLGTAKPPGTAPQTQRL